MFIFRDNNLEWFTFFSCCRLWVIAELMTVGFLFTIVTFLITSYNSTKPYFLGITGSPVILNNVQPNFRNISEARPMVNSANQQKSNLTSSNTNTQTLTISTNLSFDSYSIKSSLDTLTQKAALILSAKTSCIYTLNQKHQNLQLVSTWGDSDNFKAIGKNIVNRMLTSNLSVVRIDNLKDDERFATVKQLPPYNSFLAIPITMQDNKNLIGVLIVADKIDNPTFLADDEQQLLVFANENNLGLMLQNLILHEETAQVTQKFKIINLISQTFIDSSLLMDVESACRAVLSQPYLKELFEFDLAEINLWNETDKVLTTALSLPENGLSAPGHTFQAGDGYSGWIYENERSLCINDVPNFTQIMPKVEIQKFPYRSYMGTPLKMNAQFLGTLEFSAYTANAYSQKDVTILEIVAGQAAVAVGKALAYQQQLQERELASQRFEGEKKRRQLADTLRGVAEAISSQLEFDDLLNIVLQRLSDVVDFGSANVQLLQGDQLIIIGGYGWQRESDKILGLSFPMKGDNPNRLVIETQEPIIIKDAQKEYPASFGGATHKHVKSWLGIPLTYGTHILGLMALDKNEEDFFSQEDAEVVFAFANQVAVALQNARLFEEAKQQVRQLAALTEVAQSINRALELNEVLNLVLEAVFDLVGHRKGSIWLVDNDTATVKIANTHNVPDVLVNLFNESDISINSEPFASVIKTGDVLIIAGRAEEDEIANYGLPFPDDVTYVPLKTEDGIIGILAIEIIINQKNMRALVTTLADLAAVAIDSARLLGDTRRRAAEMQHLYKLGVEVSGMLEVQQVMRSVVNNILNLTSSQMGAISFLDEETNEYIIEGVSINIDPKFNLSQVQWQQSSKNDVITLWSRLTQQIIQTHQPIITGLGRPIPKETIEENGAQDDIGPAKQVAKNLDIQAILGVPILVHNQVNGAIFVGTFSSLNFTTRDLQSLSFVANQASVAVRNAQLVQRLNHFTEELEQRVTIRTEELAKTLQDLTEERDRVGTLYQIARELSTSFDLDRILNEALYLINRAIGIIQGSILLLDSESGHLIYRVAFGRDKPLSRGGLRTKYTVGYGLAGKVMEKRIPRLIPDVSLDRDWVSGKAHRSAIVVPLITSDEVLGALMLFHNQPNYFTEDHLKLVSAASAQIATAINNAELYRLITNQAERLGIMYRSQATEAAKNQAILGGITDGVLVLDASRNIMLINPTAAEILNVDPIALENQPLNQILKHSKSLVEMELTQLLYDNLTAALGEIEAKETIPQFRIEVRDKAVMVSLAPIVLISDEPQSIVAVLRDISKEAEIDRIKNEFISTVSHELRTPMTSIKGYSDLLLSGKSQIGKLNPTQHRFVKIIQSNADRLTELVNDILEISHIETGRIKLEFESLDIIKIINDVALSFEGQLVKKPINFSLHLPESLAPVYADKARLIQILVNLMGNAWQYTPEGGDVKVYAQANGDFIQIDVKDTGIGIIEKDVDYIFDRFFRSERTEVQVVDGTGLGLSITKTFVEMLGGQIWVKSELDVGSIFSFTIPIDKTKTYE